jgi:TonB family protein
MRGDGTSPAPVPAASEPKGGDAGGEASLFGSLDADQRIRATVEQHERTLWASAGAITLLYAALIASQLFLTGAGSLAEIEQRQKERRGQDGTDPINVEIVPEPDFNAKTKKWRDGAEQQSPTPSPMPPQPQQEASQAQPEINGTVEAEDEKEKPKEEETKQGGDPALDIEALVDAAAADFAAQIDHAFRKRPQKAAPERQAMYSGGGEMKVRGQGASGKSDAFTRSVIAALMKTRPGPFALWGRVLVSFEISPSGTLNYVHVVHSSGNSAMDKAAVDAIHKARFEAPPPGMSTEQRTYIIDYVFG